VAEIRHLPEQQRFLIEPQPGGPTGELDYQLTPGTVVFTHTGVPHALRGQGLAAELVEAGLHWAEAQGLRVVPACSYVEAYLRRHPAWQRLLR